LILDFDIWRQKYSFIQNLAIFWCAYFSIHVDGMAKIGKFVLDLLQSYHLSNRLKKKGLRLKCYIIYSERRLSRFTIVTRLD
jgi:hypothetical protein